jgi:ADP-ribose pyrophosphatase YjhB (NUDIX family)
MDDRHMQWLAWAREIQSLSQTGIAYGNNEYDIQRYQRLLEIAADIIASHTRCDRQPVLESFLMQAGYATPKVDVRGAVVRDGQILLVQERSDERWCLPGGWADVGAAPAEMVAREVEEESGFVVEARQVIGVYDANRSQKPIEYYHAYKILFLCEIVGGEARPSDETMAVGFFRFDELPPLSNNRTNQRHLQDVWNWVQEGHQTTAFD